MKKQNHVAFFNILSAVLLRGISFITAPLFARLLDTNGYGIVNNHNVWVSILAITGTLQTQGTLVNARVEYPEQEQAGYQSSAMTVSVLFFLGWAAVILLLISPLSALLKMDKVLILLLLVQAFGTFSVNFMNTKLTYELKADKNMALSVATALLTLGLSLLFIYWMPAEKSYLGRILGISLTYGTLGLFFCGYILLKGKTFFHRKYWKFCIALAIPLVFYNLSDLLLGHSDLVMLRQMRGDSVSGIYGLAFNFGIIIFTIFGALNNTWVPFYFDDMKQGRQEEIHAKAKNYLELYTVLSIGFILLATEVFHWYGGSKYRSGAVLIPLFVASHYVNFLCTFPVNFEYYHKRIKVVAAATILTSLVNILLNYILILRFGMIGAAVATLVSHCFQFALHYGYTRYYLGKQEYPFALGLWGKYAAAFSLSMAVVYLTPNGWLLRWCLGAGLGCWELWQIRKRKVLI